MKIIKRPYNADLHSKWVDALIAMSCFGVVCLHSNSVFWSRPTGFAWFESLFIESFFYFAVPIFYMISGYTLLGYRNRYSTTKFLIRRIKRAVIPYVFWSVFAYIALSIIRGGNGIDTVLEFFAAIANSKIVGVYWFFPPLFICYLVLPLVCLALNSKKMLLYLLALGIVSYSILPFLSQLLGIEFSPTYLHILPGSGYIIFFILGYMLGNDRMPVWVENVILCMGCVGFLVHLIGTHYCSPVGADIGKLFKGYLNWPTVLYGPSIFILVKRIYDNHDLPFMVKIVSFVRRNSLGIYLMHWWVLYIIMPKVYTVINGMSSLRESALWNISLACITTILCGYITEAIRRIKILRWIIGE